jgi:hypothetical protein
MAGFKRTRENRRLGKTCGAKTRKGTPCLRKLLFGGDKCPNHGGLSTGPRTKEGRAKSFAARDAGRDRYFQERRLATLAGLATPHPRFQGSK